MTMKFAVLGAALITALLSACSSNSFYENDGPPGFFQSSLNGDVAGAVPKVEPFAKAANRPYTVLGQQYVPMNSDLPLRQIGIASWYGKQSCKTASLIYRMPRLSIWDTTPKELQKLK